ncbi:uncharacterized protein LOC127721200 [Mytilus californianus]|uniref:uncharacterized protein LOC127721200 n=1 Tax=Mytilus californianus TaxID=6549 RepID=UPI0022468666|nr:uncharacterized protein LOC127721200 [Mytilus californianus]
MECIFEILNDCRQQSNRTLVLFTLQYLVEGIQGLVKREFELFHNSLKEDLKNHTQCLGSCSQDETKSVANWCQTCASWRTSILSSHTLSDKMTKRTICWSEIDSSKWPTDPFEVEKCFVPIWYFGPKRLVSSCDHSDLAIILKKIINCTYVYAKFDKIVKPQTIVNIRNDVTHANWISNDHKVEYCKAIGTFLFPHLDNQSAKKVYDKIQILVEISYNELISYNLISEEEVNKMHKKITSKVDRSKVYIWIFAILCICIGVMLFKIDPSNILVGSPSSGSPSSGSLQFTGCNLGYGLQFEFYLQQQRNFVGRKWLIDETFHRINVTDAKGVIMIAGPGYGKSAFVADIIKNKDHCRLKGYTIIYHICKRDVKMLQMPEKFVLNLMQRISCSYPRYQKLLEEVDTQWTDIKGVCIDDPYYCLDNFVIHQLNELKSALGHKLLIIVDGIDQCYSSQMGVQLVSLLQARYTEFPSWVKFLLTTRNDSSILQQFSDLDHFHIFPREIEMKDV